MAFFSLLSGRFVGVGTLELLGVDFDRGVKVMENLFFHDKRKRGLGLLLSTQVRQDLVEDLKRLERI